MEDAKVLADDAEQTVAKDGEAPAMQEVKDTTPRQICSNSFTNWKERKTVKRNSAPLFR